MGSDKNFFGIKIFALIKMQIYENYHIFMPNNREKQIQTLSPLNDRNVVE